MLKKKKPKKELEKAPVVRYWLTFGVLAFDAIVLIVAGCFTIPLLLKAILSGKSIPFTFAAILRFWLPAAATVISAILLPWLNNKYLDVRDEVDYDSFGNSRKSSFKNLSKQDRLDIEKQKISDAERTLPSATLKSHTHKGPADPDAEMSKMIGLTQVKNEISALAAQMAFDEQNEPDKKKKKKSNEAGHAYHMCFSGPPGTGKTSVARILTTYLYKYNVIAENKCVEVDGNMFRASNPADSTQKTVKIIQHAMGGVLFIDEAYALVGDSKNKEVVATIIKMMEDFRDDFVLILAGYENEMKELIATNPGFKSRIQHYLQFPSYSMPELDEIFRVMANSEGYVVDGDCLPRFETLMAAEQKTQYFGNARTVRNCLESSIQKHKANYMQHKIGEDKKFTLCKEDITFEKGIV